LLSTLFSELAIETFYISILLRLPKSYEAEINLIILRPFEHHRAVEFRAVVADDEFRYLAISVSSLATLMSEIEVSTTW